MKTVAIASHARPPDKERRTCVARTVGHEGCGSPRQQGQGSGVGLKSLDSRVCATSTPECTQRQSTQGSHSTSHRFFFVVVVVRVVCLLKEVSMGEELEVAVEHVENEQDDGDTSRD